MKLTLSNYTNHAFQGWVSTTVPNVVVPAEPVVASSGTAVVPGRRIGFLGREVLIHTRLAPHETRTEEWWTPTPVSSAAPPDPSTLGVPHIGGLPMALAATEVTPPRVRSRWVLRSGVLLYELWIDYYVGQAWATGELLVIASDGRDGWHRAAVDLVVVRVVTPEGAPKAHVRLRSTKNDRLPDLMLGRDQGMPVQPLLIYWEDAPSEQIESMLAWDALPVQALCENWLPWFGAVGVNAPNEPALAWSAQHLAAMEQNIGTMREPTLGPAANSTVTGQQEDQGYAFTEPFQPLGNGAQWIRYLVACGMARRPCHYREGLARIDRSKHPRLVLWNGRPHWHTGISRDRFGDPGDMSIEDWSGWFGPDREHWLIQSLAGAYLLTGSPALQELLRDQFTVFMLGETTNPYLSTSHAGAPRGIGWTALVAAWLHQTLDSDAEREELRQRFLERVQIIRREVPVRTGQVRPWKVTTQGGQDVPATGGLHWVPWEHSIAAMGQAYAYAAFGFPELRELAAEAADLTLRYGWTNKGGKWIQWDKVGVMPDDSPVPSYDPAAGYVHRAGDMMRRWTAAAASAYLRLEPQGELAQRAQEIEQQVFGDRADKWRLPR